MKKMKCSKKRLSFILCMALIVAMALFTAGCNGKTGQSPDADRVESSVQAEESGQAQTNDGTQEALQENGNASTEGNVLGEGSRQFTFTVVDKEGTETQFEIHTDKETVGEALLELGLIAGDESEYGLYVKTVNGLTVDYDTDGLYWAFYVNGEYASTGVDAAVITEGESYSFKVE